jgi:hypothetical protein
MGQSCIGNWVSPGSAPTACLLQQHDVTGDFILAVVIDREINPVVRGALASIASRISRTKSLSSFIEVPTSYV